MYSGIILVLSLGAVMGYGSTFKNQTLKQKAFLVLFAGVMGAIVALAVHGLLLQPIVQYSAGFAGGYILGFIIRGTQNLYSKHKRSCT